MGDLVFWTIGVPVILYTVVVTLARIEGENVPPLQLPSLHIPSVPEFLGYTARKELRRKAEWAHRHREAVALAKARRAMLEYWTSRPFVCPDPTWHGFEAYLQRIFTDHPPSDTTLEAIRRRALELLPIAEECRWVRPDPSLEAAHRERRNLISRGLMLPQFGEAQRAELARLERLLYPV
ncbi:MAG: hypothetical protein ACRDTO_13330 [Mycobacterium sp.]